MMKILAAAAIAAVTLAGTASAATLSGIFNVQVVNVQGVFGNQSEATTGDFAAALSGSTSNTFDVFTYSGALDFRQADNQNDSTTISQWLGTGSGSVTDLDTTVGGLQMSSPDIDAGTATTTFFLFTLANLGAGDFLITHDDGMAVFDNGLRIGGFEGPNSERTTEVLGFSGGQFDLLYVATNGDPSILEVEMTPVPVPAALPMLLMGMGGLAFMRRRARA
jgi:hypothetical protein